jgi:AmmeMemoRadiSam system protein A
VTDADAAPRQPPELDPSQQSVLLRVAADAVASVLAGDEPRLPDPADFEAPLRDMAATFVTLERGGALLGCIGNLEPTRPLVASVAHHALAAAFSDPRLPAVTTDDYSVMAVTVSHLGPLEPVDVDSYDDLAATLRPGEDGILLDTDGRQATLLPSVWRHVRDADEMLATLWSKARLAPRAWPPGTRVRRYMTLEFSDPGPRPGVSTRPAPG